MVEIRAFVGHSFDPKDQEIVRKFRDHFDHVQGLGIGFSWEHAEPAKSEPVAKQVMSLMSGKDVFIGICTRKERVVQSSVLKKMFLYRKILGAKESEFLWKASDWVIQEIGLARGNGLKLILLLEQDVRDPGGLRGDIEYIRFDRKSPEQSFNRITDMIKSVPPKSPGATAPISDTKSSPTEEEESETPEGISWAKPQPEWDRNTYEFAYWHTIWTKDQSGAAKIDKAYRKTQDASQNDNEVSWGAYCALTRLKHGLGGYFSTLKALAAEHPDSCKTLEYLAEGYVHYQDYAKAASIYEAAAIKAADKAESLRLKGRAATEFGRADAPEKSLVIVRQMKIEIEEVGGGELEILKVLKNLAEAEKKDEAALAIMERIVELDPSDIDSRFSLAYKHSELGNDDLGLFHYQKIPVGERSAATWNNLGVEFERKLLPAKSVNAYRKAKEKGETLAMSNLAIKFLSAGFLSEAEELCNDAMAIKNNHKNVADTLARLKRLPGEEDNKEAELIKGAKPKSDYFKQLGRAVSRPDLGDIVGRPNILTGRWKGPNCDLDVTIDGGVFSAFGSYEQQALGGLFGKASGALRDPKSMVPYKVEYGGTLTGRIIEARVVRRAENAAPPVNTLLGLSIDSTKVLMFLTDDEDELRVMENPSASAPWFYTLKRQTDV